MEQTPWKPVLFGAIFSFILLLFVYFIALPKQVEDKKVERILNFESSRIIGRSGGKKVWEFSAIAGWVGKNKNITNLENVTDGIFFSNGDILIKNFTAKTIKAFHHSKNIEAKETKALIAVTHKKAKKARRFMKVSSDFLRYDPDQEKSWLTGNIKLTDKKTYLSASSAEIDHDKETAYLNKDIYVKRSDVALSAGKLKYNAAKEEIVAQNKVSATITDREKTRLKCLKLTMYIDEDRDIIANNNIEVIQGKKAAIGDRAVYNKKKQSVIISGNVKTVIEKGKEIIRASTALKLKNEEIKDILEDETVVAANSISISTKSGDFEAIGDVLVQQKGKEAKSQKAVYLEKNETITLTGNVSLKQEKRWVDCDKVIVSVDKQTFEAFGGVEAEFEIKK